MKRSPTEMRPLLLTAALVAAWPCAARAGIPIVLPRPGAVRTYPPPRDRAGTDQPARAETEQPAEPPRAEMEQAPEPPRAETEQSSTRRPPVVLVPVPQPQPMPYPVYTPYTVPVPTPLPGPPTQDVVPSAGVPGLAPPQGVIGPGILPPGGPGFFPPEPGPQTFPQPIP